MNKLISQTRCGEIDELKRRILAQTRVMAWMKQVLAVYDRGEEAPSDARLYCVVAGAAVSYYRGVVWRRADTSSAIDQSIRSLLKDVWYDTVVGEVRCIQGHNQQTGRRNTLQRVISEADEQLLRDVRRLECRIGHGPEMESFEAEVAEATHEVSANVQMLRRSLRGANAVRQPYWRMIDGGREDSSPSSGDSRVLLQQIG